MSENITEPRKTTIPVDISTRERLKQYGKKGETWNNLMLRIFDEYDKMRNFNINKTAYNDGD